MAEAHYSRFLGLALYKEMSDGDGVTYHRTTLCIGIQRQVPKCSQRVLRRVSETTMRIGHDCGAVIYCRHLTWINISDGAWH